MVEALRTREVGPDQVASVAGWPDDPERAERIVSGLIADGLIVRRRAGALSLP